MKTQNIPQKAGLNIFFIVSISFLFLNATSCSKKVPKQPNIVIIYADDMGYGDLNCQNPNSKIPTP